LTDHGLNLGVVAVVAACLVGWGIVSERFSRWNISAPIAFVSLGLITTNGPLAFTHVGLHSSTILSLVEITLALVLFGDAARVNVWAMRGGIAIPVRLLGIGLPLAIGVGTALALGLFGGSIWVAAAVGAIVAPTDAALGAQIMADERIPGGVRRALNIESGLNDGIATPFVNLFLAGALATEVVSASGVGHAVVDMLGGAVIGVAVSAIGGLLLTWSRRTGWAEPALQPLAILALAILAFALARVAGMNGFIAAFMGGMAFGSVTPVHPEERVFTEESGELLSLIVWFVFGAVMVVPGIEAATWRDVAFGLLALSVARMAPVAVALFGSGLDRATVAFIGWFGPRGLASVVFGLIAVDSLDAAAAHLVLGAVTVTVAMSVLAHGLSAGPLAARYARTSGRLGPEAPEHAIAPAIPSRSTRSSRRRAEGPP